MAEVGRFFWLLRQTLLLQGEEKLGHDGSYSVSHLFVLHCLFVQELFPVSVVTLLI